jgi:hypothetical protein
METLGEAYPVEQARVRRVLGLYKELGKAGAIGCVIIEDVLRRADIAAMSGDVVQMIRMYQEMKGVKE